MKKAFIHILAMSAAASRLWTSLSRVGRDSLHIGSAFAKEAGPIVRRQTTQLTFGDALRNVLVSEARQSNQVANNFLKIQQHYGLMQYHGLVGYWRQRQQALQDAGGEGSFSTDSNNTDAGTGGGTPAVSVGSSEKGNVAQVAFMITSAMRTELSGNLGYTAEQIKSLTPVDASLILHHKVKPDEKEEKLPGLLEAHQAEQERIAKIEEQKQQEQEKQAEEDAKLLASKQTATDAATEQTKASDQEAPQQLPAEASSPTEPNEGLLKLEDPTVAAYNTETSQKQRDEATAPDNNAGSAVSNNTAGEAPVGSFVESIEEQVDTRKEWYEIVETRTEDNSQTPVALFSSLEEAEMAMDLKTTFAERRAKEKLSKDKDSVVETTYTIQKTIK